MKKPVKSLNDAVRELKSVKKGLKAIETKELSEQQIQDLREEISNFCVLIRKRIEDFDRKSRKPF